MFHYIFPIITMGLAPFVACYSVQAYRANDPARSAVARFWTKIFGLAFAVGVVTGIPLEFQFGTNWAQFSARTGAAVGVPLAMEGTYAFFLESVFLGALLYGRGAIVTRLQAISAMLVWIGSWLSGYFIIATDAWMQHPVGYSVEANGTVRLDDLAALLFSKFAGWQFAHVMTGALVTGGFLVAGIGAFYLLSQRFESVGKTYVRHGVIVALLASIAAIFPTGDRNSDDVTEYQPVKLAAMEGLFASQSGAPLAIIGMPDVQAGVLIDPIVAPRVLSFLAYGNFDANVAGLQAYPRDVWPPVELTYYAYHIMVGLGTIFAALAALAALLLWMNRLYQSRWLLWLLMLTMPFPFIANEAGWIVTEVGRQPWIVYGLLKTSDAISPNVVTGETVFTTIGFAGMYFVLGLLFIVLVLREIGNGPRAAEAP
jgi:cytochrome bd ubiquinol oxidase subunit I